MLLTLRWPDPSAPADSPRDVPGGVRTAELAGGRAHLFHPGPDEVAVLVELDTAGLPFPERAAFPPVALLAEAAGVLLPAALPADAGEPRSVEVRIPGFVSTGGEMRLGQAFQPLRYAMEPTPLPLDPRRPEAEGSWLYSLVLRGRQRPRDVVSHLRVLLRLFDVSGMRPHDPAEGAAMWAQGRDWLERHPKREMLERRLLLGGMRRDLHGGRHEAVVAALRESGARRVLDLGCGAGALMTELLREPRFTEVVGVEPDRGALAQARAAQPPDGRARVLHGSVAYRDGRLEGFDAAAVVEVIEHLDPPQLAAFEDAVFAGARPGTVVLTTPNADYNTLFEYHREGNLRHADHRFEWTRAEFQAWARGVAARHGYAVRFGGVGPAAPDVGSLTQMAVFGRLPAAPGAEGDAPSGPGGGLRLEDVAGERTVVTPLGPVHVSADESAAALEAVSRFVIDPRWLVYVPPTLPAARTAPGTDAGEHPSAALAYYRAHGAGGVALRELQGGTRVVAVVCRNAAAARRRFGAAEGEAGAVYTAEGRAFFAAREAEAAFLEGVREAFGADGGWAALGSDWVALEGVMGPGVPGAREVNAGPAPAPEYFWGAAAAERAVHEGAEAALARSPAAGADGAALLARVRARAAAARAYQAACRRLDVPLHPPEAVHFAPLRLLASEGAVHAAHDVRWHGEQLGEGDEMTIDFADPGAEARADAWWEAVLAAGGAGIVVHPLDLPDRGEGGPAPAVVCRGPDALLLAHGPEPSSPEDKTGAGLEADGARAAREWALSREALERVARGEPLARVHPCVFAALGVKLGGQP
jgi:SAM-dependent methyltransferase